GERRDGLGQLQMSLHYAGASDDPQMDPFRNAEFLRRRPGGRPPRSCAYQDSRSKIIAMPWPPPTHMVSRPKVLSWNCRLFRIVEVIRAPVIPNGCPTAIAPPLTFSLSMSMPRSR